MRKFFLIAALAVTTAACDQLQPIIDNVGTSVTTPPTKTEIASGIREALIVGAKNSIAQTSQTNGFLNNALIKIPFPPEAEKVKETALNLGLDKQVDKFVETLNRGAEEAASKATPIFVSAIQQMTLQDVYDIWKGENDAATQYLIKTTRSRLENEFRPVIKNALDKVEVTRYWNPLAENYNKIPFVQKINPDLDQYVLERSLNGLFTVIAQEEARIREDPSARVSDVLKKVFGYLDN